MTALHRALKVAAVMRAAKRKPRRREEHTIQGSIFDQMQQMLPHDAIITSVDHAGEASAATRALRKKRGIEAGIPDLWIFWSPDPSAHRIIMVPMETKAGKNGLTIDQEHWRDALLAIGAYWCAPRTPEEAYAAVLAAGIPLSGRLL